MKNRNMEKWTAAGREILDGSNMDLTVSEIKELAEMANGDIYSAMFYAFEVGAAVGARMNAAETVAVGE